MVRWFQKNRSVSIQSDFMQTYCVNVVFTLKLFSDFISNLDLYQKHHSVNPFVCSTSSLCYTVSISDITCYLCVMHTFIHYHLLSTRYESRTSEGELDDSEEDKKVTVFMESTLSLWRQTNEIVVRALQKNKTM